MIAVFAQVVAGLREVPYEYGVEPSRARVKAGTTVTWTNNGKETHAFAARDGSWQTGPIKPGESGSVTIEKPGTYEYICREHPWTIGQLIVQ